MGKVDELELIINGPKGGMDRRWAFGELCKAARKGGPAGAKAYRIIGGIARDPSDFLYRDAQHFIE